MQRVPHGDEPGIDERKNHHRQDRHVQKDEPGYESAARQPLPSLHTVAHLFSVASARLSRRCNIRIGTTSSRSMKSATALATGQSRLRKNSSESTRPIMSWSVGPRSEGMTYSPTAGMNTNSAPAMIPGT